MALGGHKVSWDTTKPAASEAVGLGDDRMRSILTSAFSALDSEHIWHQESSASTAGAHRLGSARAFVGTQSRVSSSDTDGRMMITSDTSRLFGVGSGGSVLLGAGPLSLSLGSMAPITMPQRLHAVIETGNGTSSAGGEFSVTFPNSGFSARPFLICMPASVQTTHTEDVRLLSCTASAFTGMTVESGTGNVESSRSFEWIAIGYRAL